MLDRIDMRRASSVPELKHTPLSSMATDQFLGHAYHAYHAYLPICLFAFGLFVYLYIQSTVIILTTLIYLDILFYLYITYTFLI